MEAVIMDITSRQVRDKILNQTPEVRKEYDALESYYLVLKNLIHYRIEQNMSTDQLADKAGIYCKDIEAFETDTESVSLSILCKIADTIGLDLYIKLQPKSNEGL